MNRIYLSLAICFCFGSIKAANVDVDNALGVVNKYYANLRLYMIDTEKNLSASDTIYTYCVTEPQIKVKNDFQNYFGSEFEELDYFLTMIEEITIPDGEIKEQFRMDYRILKTDLIETPVFNKKIDRPYNYISVLVEKSIYSKLYPKGQVFREQVKYEVDKKRIVSIRPENFDNLEHELEITRDVSILRLYADEFYSNKQYDLAYKAYRKIVDIENGDKEAFYRLGLMLLKHHGGNGLSSEQKDEEAIKYFSLAVKTIYPGCVLPIYYQYERKKRYSKFKVKIPDSYRRFVQHDERFQTRSIDQKIATILFNVLEISNLSLQMCNNLLNVSKASNIGWLEISDLDGINKGWVGDFLNLSYSNAQKYYLNNNLTVKAFPSVGKNGKWGYVNSLGEVIIPFQFDEAREFNEGLAPVCINKKYGYIDEKGNLVIDAMYDDAYPFSEGRAAVKIKDDFGYISASGLMIIRPEFEAVSPFFNNGIDNPEDKIVCAIVMKFGELFKINTRGEIIAEYVLTKGKYNGMDKENKAYWKFLK